MAKNDKLAKRGSGETGLANWDAELAKYAAEAAASVQTPGGNFISFKAGMLRVAGQPVEGNKAQVLILDFVHENCYFEGDYDEDNPRPPVCYAFGRGDEDMTPYEKAAKPQSERCANCPHNQWGTAEKGKGKACKNIERLALISMNNVGSSQQVKDSELYFAKLPVTSVRGWSKYVQTVANVFKRPPFGVVTTLSTAQDPKSQFKVIFTDPEPVDKALSGGIMAKVEEAKGAIITPYPEPPPEDAAPAKKGKGRKF